MMIYTNNWLAILVAVIANFVVGWLWYGMVFKNLWVSLSGHGSMSMDEMKSKGATATRGYIVTIILGLITPFVFFSLAQSLLVSAVGGALMLVFWIWLGFQVPITVGSVLWDAKPWGLFFLNAANQLVSLVVTALIYAWMVV
ncbi:DUF1761 domain-containing protein [Candidatus Parcubacteria bacterium]|nr:DUF1761 domain-containing protein [Candidatus Parcubacteria bacterium]